MHDIFVERQRHFLLTYIESTNKLLDTLLIASEILGLDNHLQFVIVARKDTGTQSMSR